MAAVEEAVVGVSGDYSVGSSCEHVCEIVQMDVVRETGHWPASRASEQIVTLEAVRFGRGSRTAV